MKIVLVFVTTLDGKVTKWGDSDIKAWTSLNDQEYFNKAWNETSLIVMGSNTFNEEPFKPSNKHLLVVMTKHPAKYRSAEVLGQLEFTDKSPVELVHRYETKGHELMLVVGGANVATSFLKDQLVDELWLTIEPKIFGTGGNFVVEEKLNINLRLISCEKVNDQGTLITKYIVEKNKSLNVNDL